MATYAEIERERVNNKKYVTYTYNKMHPQITDDFFIDANWCKYWIGALAPNCKSRLEIYNENIVKHDYYAEKNDVSFLEIERILKQNGMSPEIIEYFKRLTTINVKGDKTCQLMVFAGATIDFDLLIEDVNKAGGNYNEISKILHTLTKQVNIAALNGAISKLYDVTNTVGKNANTPDQADAYIEAQIAKLYKRITIGDKNNKPYNIPENPNEIFNLPLQLNELILEYSKKFSGLSQSGVINNVLKPIETTINKSIAINQARGK